MTGKKEHIDGKLQEVDMLAKGGQFGFIGV
jgi:hypothetical protein